MISPGIYNITYPQGATFDKTATWTIGGTAVNLGGYTARSQIRETYDSTAVILSLSTGGSGITLGGTAGTITWGFTATQGAAIPAGQYVYDLEVVSSTGQVTRLLEGWFTVTPEVTR